MAIQVTGADIKGVNNFDIPFVEGDNNLIKITIDNPINLNLETFQEHIYPYLDGSNNIVNIEITGAETYVDDIQLTNDYKLLITKKTIDGSVDEVIQLPYTKDGEIENIIYNNNDKIMTVNYIVEGAQGSPIITSQLYDVIETDEIITSITARD